MRISNNNLSVSQLAQPEIETTNSDVVATPEERVSQEPERIRDSGAGASLITERQFAASAQQAMLFGQLEAERTVPDRSDQINKTSAPSDVLVKGSQGSAVKDLQNQLNQFRIANGQTPIQVTGFYGNDTENAVKEFQAAKGLDADGIAGGNTKARLSLENNAEFQKLDTNSKEHISKLFQGFQKDPVARDNLVKFATDPNLAKLPPESQETAIKSFEGDPANATHLSELRSGVERMAFIETQSDFKSLDPVTQDNFRVMMFNGVHTEASRQALEALALSGDMKNLSNEESFLAMQTVRERQDSPASEKNFASLDSILNSKSFKDMTKTKKEEVLQLALENAKDPEALAALAKFMGDEPIV